MSVNGIINKVDASVGTGFEYSKPLEKTDLKTYSLARKIFEGFALIIANISTLGMINVFKSVRDEYKSIFSHHSGRSIKKSDTSEKPGVRGEKEKGKDSTQLMTETEFAMLSSQDKFDVYRKANIEGNFDLVTTLNELRMQPSAPAAVPPGIISPMMDIATKRATLLKYLQNLRQQGRLFTEDEFAQNKETPWVKKDTGFERVLGADLIQQKSDELGLKRIKVPKKVLVIRNSSADHEELRIRGWCGQENLYHMISDGSPTKDDPVKVQFYAQRVKPVSRCMTREEIDEFFEIVEATNFVDLQPSNVFLCHDGVYFIDTEFKSLSGSIQWEKMNRFLDYIAEEDREYFHSEIEKRLSQESEAFSPSKLTYAMANILSKMPNAHNQQQRQWFMETRRAFQAVGADETDLDCFHPREFIFNRSEILGH